MATGLVNWAHAVKQKRRRSAPVLWLFTDGSRLADPLPAVAGLPKGLCGVVFRHDGAAERAALGVALARLCKSRRLVMVVAGDVRLAARLGAGVHLRGGRWPGVLRRRHGIVTSSAHDGAALRRARLAGAQIVFLSPALATASHPGARPLGAVRWANLARQARGVRVFGLGGMTGQTVSRLGNACAGAGAIGALSRQERRFLPGFLSSRQIKPQK